MLRTRPIPFLVIPGTMILLLAMSCSSRRVSIIIPASEPLASFSVLEVAGFDSNVADIESEVLVTMRTAIIREVSALDRFRSVTSQSDDTEGVLQFKGVILSYEKGSRAKRYLLGLGTGKAFLTVRCTMVNKSTGDTVFEGDFEGEISGGLFGGSSRSTERAVIAEIVDYFREKP